MGSSPWRFISGLEAHGCWSVGRTGLDLPRPVSYHFRMLRAAIFDKSFIHGISAEEAAVFDMHFASNLTPLFFIEILADLEKAGVEDIEARQTIVRTLSAKTPSLHSYPNVPHHIMIRGELLGHQVAMDGRPVIGSGRRVRTIKGPSTIYEPPEMKAAKRWKDGLFSDQEFALALEWRNVLKQSPELFAAAMQGRRGEALPKDLAALKSAAEAMIDRDGLRMMTLRVAMETSGMPSHEQDIAISRWKASGGPKLADFAPYARHVIVVDLFRMLAMAAGLISPELSSNYADIAYLYYFPFCEVFVSADKLHRRCAPLFLRDGQRFVWGPDIRPHLADLREQYLNHPDHERLGVYRLSQRMKFAPDSFLGALCGQEASARENLADKLSPEAKAALMDHIEATMNARTAGPRSDVSSSEGSVMVKRSVPANKGRLFIFPKNVK